MKNELQTIDVMTGKREPLYKVVTDSILFREDVNFRQPCT
jgi:hypothetical protein